jgi:hypothetical protein
MERYDYKVRVEQDILDKEIRNHKSKSQIKGGKDERKNQ